MSFTIASPIHYVAEPIKGSRFVVDASPVTDEDGAQALLAEVVQNHPDASHHCSAWRLARPAIDRASDDGEPSGSAGRPILAQLVGRDLVGVAVVVTRWFGGTKLGIGGLVRAYGNSAGAALDAAKLIPWLEMGRLHLTHDYSANDAVDRAVAACGGTTTRIEYGGLVARTVELALDRCGEFEQLVTDATAGDVEFSHDEQRLPTDGHY